jgi:hypothetical protein
VQQLADELRTLLADEQREAAAALLTARLTAAGTTYEVPVHRRLTDALGTEDETSR